MSKKGSAGEGDPGKNQESRRPLPMPKKILFQVQKSKPVEEDVAEHKQPENKASGKGISLPSLSSVTPSTQINSRAQYNGNT